MMWDPDELARFARIQNGAVTPKKQPGPPRPPRTRSELTKGTRGEQHAVRVWRRNGYDAYRQPGSGSIRGAVGELPELPGDIAGIDPWICEVKWDERVNAPSRSGIRGEAFIRSTLRKLQKLLDRYATIAGSSETLGCAWFRHTPPHRQSLRWRIFVPSTTYSRIYGGRPTPSEWVELTEATFFDHFARQEPQELVAPRP